MPQTSQTVRNKSEAVWTDLLPVLAGIAAAVSAVGIALALADVRSPLRAPFILFFLFAGPAGGLATALSRYRNRNHKRNRNQRFQLIPGAHATAAATGALVIDLVVAQTISISGFLTINGGIVVVIVITALLFLPGATETIKNMRFVSKK
ncbi:hypothetical protein ACIHCQ_08685 [Streptomyces sp. NPDC052236]|uniref:hypothetical protein n=1 Tax=Streptomyces sp. NPDC052236 TaxID=3365686 RepID=UPI0037CFE45E